MKLYVVCCWCNADWSAVRPKANIMVWHLDRSRVADYFDIEFRVALLRHVSQIQCQLYTVPLGGSMPSGPGWMPDDIHAHVH
jgi:hypothetical protein